MSATPLTDAAVYEEDTGYNGMVSVVSPSFARELETSWRAAVTTVNALGDRLRTAQEKVEELAEANNRLARIIGRLDVDVVAMLVEADDKR